MLWGFFFVVVPFTLFVYIKQSLAQTAPQLQDTSTSKVLEMLSLNLCYSSPLFLLRSLSSLLLTSHTVNLF